MAKKSGRIFFLDELRGLALIGMIVYHTAYDLRYIFGLHFNFDSAGWNAFQLWICCTFIIIAGISCRLSKNSLKHGVVVLSAGMLMTLGTYFFALAAMKQTIAMAVLCHSVLALRDKKYFRFSLLVFVAGLLHTYAWVFFVLLFLTGKPWSLRTYAVVAVTVAIMLTFNSSISRLLEYADEIGKSTSEELIFSGDGMNILRVAVYSIVPVASLLFRRILEPQMERKHYILLHMSIVSFMFMLLASINGANMFGRMARYFEVGTVYMFPWIIRHLFVSDSQKIVVPVYVGAFGVFATYQYWGFDLEYSSISLWKFFSSLL